MPSSYTNLYTHMVFSTKGRVPIIGEAIDDRLHEYIGGVIGNRGGTCLIANGTEDHEHILARLRQDRSLSDVVRDLKAASSRWIHDEFRMRSFAWQRGYGAFSVSESLVPNVIDYIARQKEHHRRRSFEDEFIAMLKANRIEYDERYLFHE